MTEGNPVQLLLVFAVPMLIGNIFQQLYNLVDSVIVGKFVGADALAAVGATGSVSFLFLHYVTALEAAAELLRHSSLVPVTKKTLKRRLSIRHIFW